MSGDAVGGDGLDEGNLVVGLEVSNLLFYASNDLEIVDAELKLSVDVNLVRYLPQCVSHYQHISFLQCRLQVNFLVVLHEHGHP